MAKIGTRFSCNACGHSQPKWEGKCPSCEQWGSLEEVVISSALASQKGRVSAINSKVWALKDISLEQSKPLSTGIHELDRALGGGLTPGSLVLLGGEPGIGKSTLLLQLCQSLGEKGTEPLYISGEESLTQIATRAVRLGVKTPSLRLLSEVSLEAILQHLLQIRPSIVMIDSIQTVVKDALSSSAGSPLQLKECTSALLHIAKQYGIAIVLVGHITKSGELAGPKVLEHMVDTVLSFERDRTDALRFLRVTKNRFGPTDELALFSMEKEGLVTLETPSHYFVKQRIADPIGSILVPVIEGSRVFILDVQALVCKSCYPTAMRKASGIDPSRLTILLAVLERYTSLSLTGCDVFVSLTEGLRVQDASLDLAILLAIASAALNKPISINNNRSGACAEIGLNGQLRPVKQIAKRCKELHWMGVPTLLVAQSNCKADKNSTGTTGKLLGVSTLAQALKVAFHLNE